MKRILLTLTLIIFLSNTSNAQKVTALTEDTSPSTDDLVMTVDSPSGTAASKKVTLANLKTLMQQGVVTSVATTLPITGGTITSTGTIGINNAAADGSTKGAVAFNSSNFSCTSGVCNTIQGISPSAAPFFAGLTLSGQVSMSYTSSSSSPSSYPLIEVSNASSSTNSISEIRVRGNSSTVSGYLQADGLGTGVVGVTGFVVGTLGNHPVIMAPFQAEMARFDSTGFKLKNLTASRPLVLNGSNYVNTGTYTGSTTTIATSTGTLTTNNCAKWDASGNIVDAGTTCGGGTSQAFYTLTDAATIATDCSNGVNFKVTLGGNRTLGNPTNASNGQRYVWMIIQDGTGGRTISLDTKFAYGTDISSISLTTTASKRDFLTAIYSSADDKFYIIGFIRGF